MAWDPNLGKSAAKTVQKSATKKSAMLETGEDGLNSPSVMAHPFVRGLIHGQFELKLLGMALFVGRP